MTPANKLLEALRATLDAEREEHAQLQDAAEELLQHFEYLIGRGALIDKDAEYVKALRAAMPKGGAQ